MKFDRDYLLDMQDYINKVAHFTREGRDAFFADERTQLAVMRAYEVIGEIAKRLPEDLLNQHPEVEWRKIKSFRDYLAHHYDEVVLQTVWLAVEKLPALRRAVESLLAQFPEK